MRRLNQKGSAVVVLLIVTLLVATGGVGYFVFTRQQDSNKKATDAVNNSSLNQSSGKSTKALEISALGVRINDPDGRNLQVHAQKDCEVDCDTSTKLAYSIRDNNDTYFARCEYPAGVTESTAEDFARSQEIPGSYQAKNNKKIGAKYYYIFPGTHYQSPCDKLQEGDEEYEDEIRQYIVDNLVAL